MWLKALIAVALAYLLGNLNGAIYTSKLQGEDVRAHGSGNAGLTNFIRNYGVNRSLPVLLIDAGKGVLACVMGGLLLSVDLGFQTGAALGGAGVMLGHILPVFFAFRGGKGILTGFFVALVVDWRIALLILAVFAVAYFTTKYVSFASVCASVIFGVSFAVLHYDNVVIVVCGVFMATMATFMHRQNILRLIKGEESKTNLFKKV